MIEIHLPKYLYLMIKTHQVTGLKYLCKRVAANDASAISYKGSGKYWKNHLRVHGNSIHTEVLTKLELDKIEEFSKLCLEYSNKYDVVNSESWANLIEENGLSGAVVGENNPSKRIEVNLKRSKSLTGKYRGQLANFFGKKHTDETKRKISESNKGNNNVMVRRPDSLAKMIATKNTIEYKKEASVRAIEINSRYEVKEKIRQSKLGNKNPAADKNIYKLRHVLTNNVIEGTRCELVDRIKQLYITNNHIDILSISNIGEFFRKNRTVNKVKGWIKI